MKHFYAFFILFLTTLISLGQDPYQEGYTLLETGRFKKAAQFFKLQLASDPINKTANICYARAIGLSGETEKATIIFKQLIASYPKDFEVQINYYESLLWNKKYQLAKPLYEDLVARNPKSFTAILGYANTLSNLKEYGKALIWVNKAIALEPNNADAKISKKYIMLGFADQLGLQQNYPLALRTLKTILIDFPEDKEVLLNLANIYLITKASSNAIATFKRYATSATDSITALNGMALVHHIDEKDKAALTHAEMAMKKVKSVDNRTLIEQTYCRYIQALIWNKKFGKARKQIDSLSNVHRNSNWIYALKGTLGLYTGDTKSSVINYEAILKNDSLSFDGNLGLANALFASDRITSSYKATFKTLEIYNSQKDAFALLEKLNANHTPSIEEHFLYTFDNGGNAAYSHRTTAILPWSTRFRSTLTYQFRTTENILTQNKANSNVLLANFDYKIWPNTKVIAVLGINNARLMTTAFTQPIVNLKLKLKPLRLQNLELGYQREVQNFNADLIQRDIVLNHLGITYHLGTNIDLGWYTQLMHTQQTDGNTRNLLFTSLYYNLMRKPFLKAGVNYQYMAFKNQVPAIYFSPEKYQVVELFSEIKGVVSEKTRYHMSIATGIQQITAKPKTIVFRAEAELRHSISRRLQTSFYSRYSSVATATAVGFKFTELGFSLKWLFTEKPLFVKNINN